MAKAQFAFGKLTVAGEHAGVAVVRYNATSEWIDTSGSSQATTATTGAGDGVVVSLASTAANPVTVAFGEAPTATAGGAGMHMVNPGETRAFGGFPAGIKAAVIDGV